MFSLTDSLQYYLCTGATDMRKGFDTLSGVVRSQMGRDPLSGDVFIFLNRQRTTVKLLHWERGGLVIYHKRLESHSKAAECPLERVKKVRKKYEK